MSKQKKLLVIIIFLVLILVMIILITLSFMFKSSISNLYPQGSLTPEQKETVVQENYAKERQTFLQSHPWINSLPLKGTDYFVSYDPTKDTMLVSLFYKATGDKNTQLAQAKANALIAMKNSGIDVETTKIEYFNSLIK